jgi:hypothetical protein
MEINEISLINQSVFESFIDDIDNELLIQELNDFYLRNIGSSEKVYGFPEAGDQTRKLCLEIDNRVSAIAQKKMFCRGCWMISMNKQSSPVPQHSHKTNKQLDPTEYYSFAYYPRAEQGAAPLNFVANYCNTMTSRISVPAETGKLLVFNAYLEHYTDVNQSDTDRICISGNYWPVEPNTELRSDWGTYRSHIRSDSRQNIFSK